LLVNADPTALAAFPQHIRFCRKSLRCYQRGCCLGFSEQFSTVEGRLAFWKAVHERMGKLANRVNDPGRILGQAQTKNWLKPCAATKLGRESFTLFCAKLSNAARSHRRCAASPRKLRAKRVAEGPSQRMRPAI
jgi:hypothetical protein